MSMGADIRELADATWRMSSFRNSSPFFVERKESLPSREFVLAELKRREQSVVETRLSQRPAQPMVSPTREDSSATATESFHSGGQFESDQHHWVAQRPENPIQVSLTPNPPIRRGPLRATPDEPLLRAEAALAVEVNKRLRAERRIRKVHDPGPIPVRWSVAPEQPHRSQRRRFSCDRWNNRAACRLARRDSRDVPQGALRSSGDCRPRRRRQVDACGRVGTRAADWRVTAFLHGYP